MFKIINEICAAICLSLFFLTGSLCGLSPRNFGTGENFSLWLGVENEKSTEEKSIISLPWHYSPFWGVVMLQSGFMERVRFCGNKKLGYFKKDLKKPKTGGDGKTVLVPYYETNAKNPKMENNGKPLLLPLYETFFRKGDRRYYDAQGNEGDKGNSAIEKVQILLFPSVSGTLNYFVNHKGCIGYKIYSLLKSCDG
ncbi:hypothetical protein FACS189449_09640 [Alphaproteobacteria bacterium]|nr:hypothetical protein FACS189449_09640 [Alphaproteobacteria bacterium]